MATDTFSGEQNRTMGRGKLGCVELIGSRSSHCQLVLAYVYYRKRRRKYLDLYTPWVSMRTKAQIRRLPSGGASSARGTPYTGEFFMRVCMKWLPEKGEL